MKFGTTRFGEIEIGDDAVIAMPDGMLGFSEFTKYVLIQHKEGSPFLWYQAIDDPNLAFVLTDPFTFFPNYEVALPADDMEALGCRDLIDLAVFVVVVIPENPEDMTANLRGPVVVNVKEKTARQVVLTDGRYSPHHSIMQEVRKRVDTEHAAKD
jgi:flagellar assembly factor FliW